MNYLIATTLLFLVSLPSSLKAQEQVSIYKENEPVTFYAGETLFVAPAPPAV